MFHFSIQRNPQDRKICFHLAFRVDRCVGKRPMGSRPPKKSESEVDHHPVFRRQRSARTHPRWQFVRSSFEHTMTDQQPLNWDRLQISREDHRGPRYTAGTPPRTSGAQARRFSRLRVLSLALRVQTKRIRQTLFLISKCRNGLQHPGSRTRKTHTAPSPPSPLPHPRVVPVPITARRLVWNPTTLDPARSVASSFPSRFSLLSLSNKCRDGTW